MHAPNLWLINLALSTHALGLVWLAVRVTGQVCACQRQVGQVQKRSPGRWSSRPPPPTCPKRAPRAKQAARLVLLLQSVPVTVLVVSSEGWELSHLEAGQ